MIGNASCRSPTQVRFVTIPHFLNIGPASNTFETLDLVSLRGNRFFLFSLVAVHDTATIDPGFHKKALCAERGHPGEIREVIAEIATSSTSMSKNILKNVLFVGRLVPVERPSCLRIQYCGVVPRSALFVGINGIVKTIDAIYC